MTSTTIVLRSRSRSRRHSFVRYVSQKEQKTLCHTPRFALRDLLQYTFYLLFFALDQALRTREGGRRERNTGKKLSCHDDNGSLTWRCTIPTIRATRRRSVPTFAQIRPSCSACPGTTSMAVLDSDNPRNTSSIRPHLRSTSSLLFGMSRYSPRERHQQYFSNRS